MRPLNNPKKISFQTFFGVKAEAHSHFSFLNLLFLNFITLMHETFRPWNLNIFMRRFGSFKILEQSRLLGLNLVIGNDGLMSQVRCMICTFIEGNDKLLSWKLDTLNKHVAKEKIVVSMGVAIRVWFFNKNFMHAKNEMIYVINLWKQSWICYNPLFILDWKTSGWIHHDFSPFKPWLPNVWFQNNQGVVLYFENKKQLLKTLDRW